MNVKILLRLRHLDKPLIISLLLLSAMGLIILYSASNQHIDTMIRQVFYLFVGFGVMLTLAQLRTQAILVWIPWLYLLGILLLVVMLFIDTSVNGYYAIHTSSYK
ncbi:Cell cycle protein, partial [Candidatus Thiomargarita nelsonii]